jgi:hypothetical protein
MRSRPLFGGIDWDLREARADLTKRHGHTIAEALKLYRRSAQSAACCADCGRALSPRDSVTLVHRHIRGSVQRGNAEYLRVAICLLCTLDAIKLWRFTKGTLGIYDKPDWQRTRCLNCKRLIRTHGRRTCCEDCHRLARNRQNAVRRRVEHEPVRCAVCRQPFAPKRADAITCSNRCRQALHRRTQQRQIPVTAPKTDATQDKARVHALAKYLGLHVRHKRTGGYEFVYLKGGALASFEAFPTLAEAEASVRLKLKLIEGGWHSTTECGVLTGQHPPKKLPKKIERLLRERPRDG